MLSFWFLFTIMTLILVWAIAGTFLINYIKQKQLGSSGVALDTPTFLTDLIEYFMLSIFIFCVALVDAIYSPQQEILVIPIIALTIIFALLTSLVIASARYLLRKIRSPSSRPS